MILVPTDAEGFSCTPVHTVAGVTTTPRTTTTCAYPSRNLVGEDNGGW